MSQITRTGSGDLQALDGSGTAAKPDSTGYVTLTVDDWYFIVGGSAEAEISGVQIVTDATIAGVFTIEVSNLPRDATEGGAATITDYNEVSGNWIKLDPSTAYIPTVGTGWSVTNATMTKTAGVGAAFVDVLLSGAKRVRIKAAITTGGTMRVNAHGKAA